MKNVTRVLLTEEQKKENHRISICKSRKNNEEKLQRAIETPLERIKRNWEKLSADIQKNREKKKSETMA